MEEMSTEIHVLGASEQELTVFKRYVHACLRAFVCVCVCRTGPM